MKLLENSFIGTTLNYVINDKQPVNYTILIGNCVRWIRYTVFNFTRENLFIIEK